jgi:hypothetical protein
VERETTEWRTAMSLFRRKFGRVFDMIRPLPDFILFPHSRWRTLCSRIWPGVRDQSR